MTSEHWKRVNDIFHAALEGHPSSRAEFIAAASGGDATLEADVLRMLAEHHSNAGSPDELPSTATFESTVGFAAGRVLSSRYRIIRFIARGGMGEVYEAEDLELLVRVALKTLLPEIASDQKMISRFKQEIQLARKITHPNVCRIYDLARHPDAASDNPAVFLTMEYLEGETLAQKLKQQGRMSPAEATPILRQIAEGLAAAHRAGVIHRDFKPANVMLVPDEKGLRAVITDFGLARSVRPMTGEKPLTATGKIAGTFDYMAPELFAGETATVASDVYALGVVMHLMVTGAKPIAGKPSLTLAPDLKNWEKAIAGCLQPNPADRYAEAGLVVKVIEGAPALPDRRFSGRFNRRTLAGTAAVAAGALWYGLGGLSMFRHGPSSEVLDFYNRGADQLHAGAYFAATKALGQACRLSPHYSMAHARLAEAWMELELPEAAAQEMLLARRSQADLPEHGRAERLYLDAVDLTLTREFSAAVKQYQAILRESGESDAEAHLDLGRAYERAEIRDKARAEYMRSTQLRPAEGAAWLKLAILRSQAAERKEAEEAFVKAEDAYQATSNLEGLTEIAYQRGVAANKRQNLEEATTFLTKALATAQVTKNFHQEIRAKLALGTSALLAGDNPLSERWARDAIDTARLNRVDSLATRGLLSLGSALLLKSDYRGAEKYYRDGLTLATQSGSGRLAANALLSLSGLHAQWSHIDESAEEAKQALVFFQKNNFARESIQCLVLMGRAQRDRGDFASALNSFNQAAVIAEKATEPLFAALAHESMGSLQSNQEHYPEALDHYEKSLSLSNDNEHIGYAAVNCANMLWRLGRYRAAQARFERAAAVSAKFDKLRVVLGISRAEMALSQGKSLEAALACKRLLAQVGEQNQAALTDIKRILGLAQIASGNRAQGVQNCEEAYREAGSLSDLHVRVSATLGILEGRTAGADWNGVLAVDAQPRSMLAQFPESNWKALTLAARANQALGRRSEALKFALDAGRQLDELSLQWGKDIFQVYLSRPDIQRVWRVLQGIPTTGRTRNP